MGRFSRIPNRDPMDQVLSIADMGMRLSQAKKNAKLSQGELDMATRKQNETERVNRIKFGGKTPGAKVSSNFTQAVNHPGGGTVQYGGTEQRKIELDETKQNLEQSKFDAEQNTATKQWETHMGGDMNVVNMMNTAEEVPSIAPAINSLIEQQGAGKVKTRWDAYFYLKGKEASVLRTGRESLIKDIQGHIKKGEDLKAAQKGQLLNVMKPGFIERVFSFPEDLTPGMEKVTMPQGKAPGRLYDTEGGWQDREGAIGKTKPTTTGDQQLTIYGPNDQTSRVSVPKNQDYKPPEGWSLKAPATKVREDMTPSETRTLDKQLADVEANLNNPANVEIDILRGYMNFFNKYSKDSMYVEAPDMRTQDIKWRRDKSVPGPKKINLPIIKGVQLTAADVHFTAKKAGVDIMEVLKQIGAVEE